MRIRVLSLLTAILLALAATTGAHAHGTVTYQGNSRDFVFAPGSDLSPTDLFDGFKGVMPGDTLIQRIRIRSDASKDVKVKLYLRALGAQSGSEAFLDQLKLTVRQAGDSPLFQAPAGQCGQLKDWQELGTFYSGAEVELLLTLEVPLEMGNEFQNAVGALDWEFGAEEFPVEPDDPASPYTGDESPLLGYILLLFLGGAGLAGLAVTGRKKKA